MKRYRSEEEMNRLHERRLGNGCCRKKEERAKEKMDVLNKRRCGGCRKKEERKTKEKVDGLHKRRLGNGGWRKKEEGMV